MRSHGKLFRFGMSGNLESIDTSDLAVMADMLGDLK